MTVKTNDMKKLTQQEKDDLIRRMYESESATVKINYFATCDLCGHRWEAVHKWPTMKADCPNCDNESYTDMSDSMLDLE